MEKSVLISYKNKIKDKNHSIKISDTLQHNQQYNNIYINNSGSVSLLTDNNNNIIEHNQSIKGENISDNAELTHHHLQSPNNKATANKEQLNNQEISETLSNQNASINANCYYADADADADAEKVAFQKQKPKIKTMNKEKRKEKFAKFKAEKKQVKTKFLGEGESEKNNKLESAVFKQITKCLEFSTDTPNSEQLKPNDIKSLINESVENIAGSSEEIEKNNRTKKQAEDIAIMKAKKITDINEEIIIKALIRSKGNISLTAKFLGFSYVALNNYITHKASDKVKEALKTGRQILIDIAENKLLQHMQSIDPRISFEAAKYVLSTLGKDRGFSQKQEIEIENNLTIAPDITAIKAINNQLSNLIDITSDTDAESIIDTELVSGQNTDAEIITEEQASENEK